MNDEKMLIAEIIRKGKLKNFIKSLWGKISQDRGEMGNVKSKQLELPISPSSFKLSKRTKRNTPSETPRGPRYKQLTLQFRKKAPQNPTLVGVKRPKIVGPTVIDKGFFKKDFDMTKPPFYTNSKKWANDNFRFYEYSVVYIGPKLEDFRYEPGQRIDMTASSRSSIHDIHDQKELMNEWNEALKQKLLKKYDISGTNESIKLSELTDMIREVISEVSSDPDSNIKSDVGLKLYFFLMDYVTTSSDPKYNTVMAIKNAIIKRIKDPAELEAFKQIFNREFGGGHTTGKDAWEYHSDFDTGRLMKEDGEWYDSEQRDRKKETLPMDIDPTKIQPGKSQGFWLSPNAKTYQVGVSHAEFAVRYMHPELGNGAFDAMFREGWVRLRSHPENKILEIEFLRSTPEQRKIIDIITKVLKYRTYVTKHKKHMEEGAGWGTTKDIKKDPKHIDDPKTGKMERWRIKFQSASDLKKHGNTEKSPINESVKPLTPEIIAAIERIMKARGTRHAAVKLVDAVLVKHLMGLTSNDLADTSIFADGLDMIEDALTRGDFNGAVEIAHDTAKEMIEDEGGEGIMNENYNSNGTTPTNPMELVKLIMSGGSFLFFTKRGNMGPMIKVSRRGWGFNTSQAEFVIDTEDHKKNKQALTKESQVEALAGSIIQQGMTRYFVDNSPKMEKTPGSMPIQGGQNVSKGELKEVIKELVNEMWVGWEQQEGMKKEAVDEFEIGKQKAIDDFKNKIPYKKNPVGLSARWIQGYKHAYGRLRAAEAGRLNNPGLNVRQPEKDSQSDFGL